MKLATKTKTKSDILTVPVKSLASVVSTAIKAVPSRPSHPILACFKIDLAEVVSITAFDLKTSITQTVPDAVWVGEPISICITAKDLSDRLVHLKDNLKITIDNEASTLTIDDGKKYKLLFQNSAEFPELSVIDDEAVQVEFTADVIEALSGLKAFSAIDESKQILTGVNILSTGTEIKGAATNGHFLAVNTVELESNALLSTNLQQSAIVLLEKLGACTASIQSNLARFQGDGWTVVSRLLEGQYPNYGQLIPKQFKYSATVNRLELISLIAAGSVAADTKNSSLCFRFGTDILKVFCDGFESEMGIEQGISDSLDTAFNCGYIASVIKAISADEVKIEFNSATSPFVFTGQGSGFLGLLMPIQVRG